MKISVIIPAHSADYLFERSIKSILESNYNDFEVIIVADGGVELPSFEDAIINIKYLKIDSFKGPAFARNLGATVAIGEVLYFTDSDVEIKIDTLTKVAQYFSDASNMAMIGSYDDEPYDQSYVSTFKNLSHHFVHQTSYENTITFWGACGGIRKSVFDKVNGFDSVKYLKPCIEDIDLGYRLSELKIPIKIVKEIQVKHLKKWTFYSFLKTDLVDRAIPWTILMAKHKTLIHNNLNLTLKNKLSAILVFLFYATIFFPIFWKASLIFFCSFILLNANLFQFLATKGKIMTFCSVFFLSCHYLVALLGFFIGKLIIIKSNKPN